MKVIFLKDVPKIGRKYEIKDVPQGFAQNSLIPRKLAVPATPEHVRRVEKERAALLSTEKEKEAHVNELLARTTDEPLRMVLPANEKGHLFKGVHVADILSAISMQYGIQLSEREVTLKNPLKDVGTYAVDVHMGARKGTCTVIIEAK